ncbi:hypothetical protein Hypma_006781 [Hypsizygus marmoreus]|uniref:Uncharacterized protein n=1 Tax=Hypsizygus marmoreus TaxID=39966 RepID=A0A369JXR3_HYPMA|nr:hypothetical protein Hypma_006781 [Hypsizygus marmoreus]
MLPIANLNIRNLYDNAAEFFSLHSPTWSIRAQSSDTSGPNSPIPTNHSIPDPLSRDSLAGLSPSSMRRELDVTKTELAKSRADVARLGERCKMLEKTLKETREMLRARDAELEKMRREREKERVLAERRRSDVGPQYQPHAPLRDLHSRHSSLDIRHSGLSNGYTNGRPTPNEQERALSLAGSDEERARIRSTEIYMTRTDAWSGAQVLQAVHDINSEILQFAASATELCTFDRNSRPSSSRSVQAMHDTSSRLGPNFARILSNRDHSQDPILVQLALQGCVTICITRALAAFCMGFAAKSDTVLSQIYSRMFMTEPQPTSSKWRALTHRQIHVAYPQLVEYSINDLCDTILRWSSDIFIIAGCLSYETTTATSKDGLRLRFGDQVRRIAKSVTRLERVTREDIMSTCFDVLAVNHSDPFDSNGMSDAFGDYVASRGAILATTELGLRCTTRLRGSESLEAQDDDVTMEQRMLLLPKVVLESVLDVLA